MLHIALVEPQIPQNTGNIARTCAATGAALHLVHPMGFVITDAKLKRAGLDYWHLLQVHNHPSVDQLLQNLDMPFYFFTTKAQQLYTAVSYPAECCLVFGREDAGLPEELLVAHREHCVRLPMREEARSLNLSNTVAIAAYEALRQQVFTGLAPQGQLHRLKWE